MKQLFAAPIVAIAALSSWSSARALEPTTTKHLSVATSTSTPSVAPGGRVALVVEITPKPNMHVYAPGQPDVIPISLTLKPGEATAAQPVQFPPAEKLELKELGDTQLVYSRPFRLVQDLAIPASRSLIKRAASRDALLTFNGVLKYQACDNTICYAPVSVPLTWSVALKADTPDVKKPR
jgi:DsbC/DsbD-like thiol-disulfide interchange protein